MLLIKNLYVKIGKKIILKDINMNIKPGKIYAIMGPNGSGKSTLSGTLVGKKDYKIISGKIKFKKENLLKLKPEDRAKKGIFISFQYPIELPGVKNQLFLQTALNSFRKYNGLDQLDYFDFKDFIKKKIKKFNISKKLLNRYVNVGFSGGEKKINDILQMIVLKPKLCILDEIDSGLDIDSLKIVSDSINKLRSKKRTFIIITHYKKILDYINPDYIYLFYKGRIKKYGDFSLVKKLENQGYSWLEKL